MKKAVLALVLVFSVTACSPYEPRSPYRPPITPELPSDPGISVQESQTPIPLPTETNIKPGELCKAHGATGKTRSGTTYVCKTSRTDAKYRWR